MHVAFRVLPVAFGAMFAGQSVAAQSETRPPIFAPQSEQSPTPKPVSTAPSLLSGRARALVASASSRVLADLKTFDVPSTRDEDVESPFAADGRAVQMSPFVVKSTALPRMKAPELPLLQFTGMGPDDTIDRRMISGFSMTLFRLLNGGEFKFNVIQGAGAGTDHGQDFVRVELAFRIRF